jgi:GT2 family glycosyltransferase
MNNLTMKQASLFSCAVLMTCHNRKEKTLSCLTSLFNGNRTNNQDKLLITCFLVDDGSTDGTSEAVNEQFPQVHLIAGSGTLYWNQGMRLAWQKALQDKSYDYYLWLNDDVTLYNDAISQLFSSYQLLIDKGHNVGALVGTLQDPITQLASYGGRSIENPTFPLRYQEVLTPTEYEIKCDYINGNCTLISAESVDSIGILSNEFTHSMGDFDYGFRLKKSGFSCWVAPHYVGQCCPNDYRNKYKNAELSFSDRITLIKKPTILPPADEWMIYVRKHAGFFWPVYYVKAWLRKILPIFWVINWR